MSLRIHHLLCIPLFVGHGYSGSFCENMAHMIRRLEENQDAPLTAVCGADMICAGCPNLTAEGACKSSGVQVEQKDAALAECFDIKPGCVYTYRTLRRMAAEKLTGEIFDGSCKNCEWYAQGLCSYEAWRKNITASF